MVARHFSAEIISAIVVSRPTTIQEVLNLLRELQPYVPDPFVTYGMKQSENRAFQPKKESFSQMGDEARSSNNESYQERKPQYNNKSPSKSNASPRYQSNHSGHSSYNNNNRGNFHNGGQNRQHYQNNHSRPDFRNQGNAHINMCDIGQFMPRQWNQAPYRWQNRTWRSQTNPHRSKPYNNGGGRKQKRNNDHGNNNYQHNGGGNSQGNQEERQEQDINVPDNQPNNRVLLNGDNAVPNAPALNSRATC